MSICPFCRKPVKASHLPCPSCGRVANDHPSVQQLAGRTIETGWGDDDDDDGSGGGLELSGHDITGPGLPVVASYGSSRTIDDDPFADDDGDAGGGGGLGLELDVPDDHPASVPRIPSGTMKAVPSPAEPAPIPEPPPSVPEPSRPVEPPAPPEPPAPKTPDPAAMIARFPPAPNKVWEAPIYFVKVGWRQLELRQDLESLRRKRSPDVSLYERALKTHDARTFAVGMAITCAALVVATFLFLLPVILRFARD